MKARAIAVAFSALLVTVYVLVEGGMQTAIYRHEIADCNARGGILVRGLAFQGTACVAKADDP